MTAVHDYENMLASFRTIDLQTLLGSFGRSVAGQKSELKERALDLLRTRSPGFNHVEYLSNIHKTYLSMLTDMSNNNVIMNHSLLQTQQRQMMGQIQAPQQRIYQPVPQTPQRQMMGQIQAPQQRMYQPVPQYPPQPMLMARGGLLQVMPQIQRSIHNNFIGANTMANIQYMSGSYQPSGPRFIMTSNLSSSQQLNVVSQDPLGHDIQERTVENNFYTPSPETVAQIKFKKLTFYEVIDVVIKPTFLAGMDKRPLQNFPKAEAINIVTLNRDVSSGENVYPYQFQIRISELVEPMGNEVTDFMPLGLHIRLGGKPCLLPPKAESRPSPRPINCTQQVKLSPITPNMININWTDDGKKYVYSMYLVKRVTSEMLIQTLQDKGGRSSEETKKYIIEKLADVDPDLATTASYRFSLVCPLSKIRMKIPVKSIHCDHLQCFDARTFILMNEKRQTWVCPTCNKPCLYDDLQIDNYFLEVVSSPTLEDCSKEIELLADGTWIVYEEKKETKILDAQSSDCVNLDSDEEKSVEANIELNPETIKRQENENEIIFINLALSDDEEESSKE
ncbi:E3 SUMO-protein ligase PIAS2-like [Acyrthosiphon pisum]|uniref:Uncharacterized protein n=1 Tax=Acyrthosiphon pisum TaxID=7029 RepID=A0A8R2B8L0_ACYPI|nr:E3 SUMO-protein ligase PIAS2-like [Acyrthosiphon pisum]|eukprot:XP_008186608.1 PREDICTED: E3 SUMO-protein ligase PIAS2-like [Acyrthosiphon pisum]